MIAIQCSLVHKDDSIGIHNIPLFIVAVYQPQRPQL